MPWPLECVEPRWYMSGFPGLSPALGPQPTKKQRVSQHQTQTGTQALEANTRLSNLFTLLVVFLFFHHIDVRFFCFSAVSARSSSSASRPPSITHTHKSITHNTHKPTTTNHQPPTTNHQPTTNQPPPTNHHPSANHQPPPTTTNHHQLLPTTNNTHTHTLKMSAPRSCSSEMRGEH